MKIKVGLVKKLRIDKSWSQEDLSEHSGLSLRTIQRIEKGNSASLESVKILAEAFDISTEQLMESENHNKMTPIEVIKTGFIEFGNFSGKATRFEYWWFFIFTLIILSAASVIHEKFAMLMYIIFLVPLVSVGARRLNDAGESVWWQLFFLIPFGQIIVLIWMAKPSLDDNAEVPKKKS